PQQRAFFEHWVTFEKAHRYRSRLIVGLGAYLNSLEGTERQLRLALEDTPKAPLADGVCFFSYAAFRKAASPGQPHLTMEDLKRVLIGDDKGGPQPPFAKPAPAPTVARVEKPTEGTLAGHAADAEGRPLDSQPVRLEPADGGPAQTLL